MTPEIDYKDTATFFSGGIDGYGNDLAGLETDVPALLVQVTRREHIAGSDATASASILHLQPDHPYLVELNYRLEGKIVRVNPFNAPGSDQLFRIESVNPARDVLLGNTVHDVECELKKVGDFIS